MKTKVRYTYISFAVSFIITIIISILYLGKLSSLEASGKWLQHTYEVKNQILKVRLSLVEAENLQRGYLITKSNKLLLALMLGEKNSFNEIEHLKELTNDNPVQQAIITKLKENASSRFRVLYETIDLAGKSDTAMFQRNAEKGRVIMNDFLLLSNRMDAVESRLLVKRKDQYSLFALATSLYTKIILFFSIILQIVSFLIIAKAFRRREAQEKILEKKIKELNLSNFEIEQMAFVASHDLQEPLRKIRTYSDRLIKKHTANLNEDATNTIEKMTNASVRMQELLQDFINYTTLIKSNESISKVDLIQCIKEVCTELKYVIDSKKAIINVQELPSIEGYKFQLKRLFLNLIDNALKFSKEGVAPLINITFINDRNIHDYTETKYVKISISDNGIGFANEFSEKIFIIFQRLHAQNSSFEGKGIGLAICKRIIMNHNGYITASGEANVGATFNLYFPAKNLQ